MKEHDMIRLIEDIPSKKLMKGDEGTIVMVLDSEKGVYEIEFRRPDSSDSILAEISEKLIELIWSNT